MQRDPQDHAGLKNCVRPDSKTGVTSSGVFYCTFLTFSHRDPKFGVT